MEERGGPGQEVGTRRCFMRYELFQKKSAKTNFIDILKLSLKSTLGFYGIVKSMLVEPIQEPFGCWKGYFGRAL